MRIKLQLRELENKPKWYGKCYRDWANDYCICYPVPLNWVIKAIREVSFWLRYPPWLDRFERESLIIRDKAWYEGYQFGVQAVKLNEEIEDKKKKLNKIRSETNQIRFDVENLKKRRGKRISGFNDWLNKL